MIKKEGEEDINLDPVIKDNNDTEEQILEGELLPLLAEKLEEITEKDKEDNTNLMFPSSDDPTDEQVEKQCSDIVVNDITIPVEIPNENKPDENKPDEPPKEEKYDNIDVTIDKKEEEDPERLKRLMTNMEVKDEVNVIKSDNNTIESVLTQPILQHPIY